MKSIFSIAFFAVSASLVYIFFQMPKDEAKNSQLECAEKQKLAVSGNALSKDEAHRFCELADARLNAAKKSIGKP